MTTANLKVTVQSRRDMFGRASGSYEAKLGETGWTAIGATRESAVELLTDTLTRNCEYQLKRRYIRVRGATFALYYASGWSYDIVHDDTATRAPSSCTMSEPNFERAYAQMAEHARQWQECQPTEQAA